MIRYDGRDSGRSTTYEPAPALRPAGLVADAAALIDALGLDRAHFAELSRAGPSGQLLAIDHGESLASLTLLATTPGDPSRESPTCREWTTGWPRSSSTRRPSPMGRPRVGDRPSRRDRAPIRGLGGFDAQAQRQYAGRVFDRSADLQATMTNPFLIDAGPRSATAWARFACRPSSSMARTTRCSARARQRPRPRDPGRRADRAGGMGTYRRRRRGRPSPRRSSPTDRG